MGAAKDVSYLTYERPKGCNREGWSSYSIDIIVSKFSLADEWEDELGLGRGMYHRDKVVGARSGSSWEFECYVSIIDSRIKGSVIYRLTNCPHGLTNVPSLPSRSPQGFLPRPFSLSLRLRRCPVVSVICHQAHRHCGTIRVPPDLTVTPPGTQR